MSHGPCGRAGAVDDWLRATNAQQATMKAVDRTAAEVRAVGRLMDGYPLFLKQQGSEFMQVPPPTQPLVSGLRGFVEDGVDACIFQLFDVGLAGCAILATAIADEHEFDLLLEVGHVFDLRNAD